MRTLPSPSPETHSGFAVTAGLAALRLLWHAARLPVLTLLLILEPLVRTVLMGIATLGVLMSLFYEFLIKLPHFPFWSMLGLSIGSAMLLPPYYGLMRLLSWREE